MSELGEHNFFNVMLLFELKNLVPVPYTKSLRLEPRFLGRQTHSLVI
jgi:hypothetical protein